jgi:hypothetical protein
MLSLVPLQVIDSFLLNYNIGQVILFFFLLALMAGIFRRSGKITAINAMLFGITFLLTPSSLAPIHYKYLGIALLVTGPIMYTSTNR